MRLAFMGTPDFAVPSLQALIAAGHRVACVYSQPPRPSGRGQKPRPSPVHAAAEAAGIEVRTPANFKSEADRAAFRALALDAAVVAAYGLILPQAILDAPRFGCLNVHASLLPRWRGAAPIQRAIWAGDLETGVMIMQMEAGLDTGPVLAEARVRISPEMTGGVLHDVLAQEGAKLLPGVLDAIAAGRARATPQGADGVTYAKKIEKAETRIDWTQPALLIERQVRALSPAPAAWCDLYGERLKVLRARRVDGAGPPGEVLDAELTVACGSSALRLLEVQPEGGRPMTAEAFLRGRTIAPGARLA